MLLKPDSDSIHQKRYRQILQFLSTLDKPKAVLDIGCQGGDFCFEMQRLGHQPHGLEIVPEAIECAKVKYPQIEFTLADCEKQIPYPPDRFDVVWAGEIIEHIRHTDIFINEINRVLKIGGLLVLTTPLHSMIKNLYLVLFRFSKHFDPEFPHYRFYTKSSLCGVLAKRGFAIDKIRCIGRIPIIANDIFVVARKMQTKAVLSTYHY